METAVDKHLARRIARISDPKMRGFLPSLLIHASIVGFLLLGPLLAPNRPKPIEVRSVQIVPLQALGVPNPPARTQRPTPPAPKVEEPEPQPKPEPEKQPPAPEPRDAMVIPDEKKKKPPAKPVEKKPEPPPPAAPDRSAGRASGSGSSSAPPQRQGSSRGHVAGTSAFGGAVGLDDPNFTYGYYVDQMLALISAQWFRPDVGDGIEAELHFRVHRSGTITELEIRTPSGSSTFDLAAMRAIRNATPLPPLPGGYPHDSLGVNLLFR